MLIFDIITIFPKIFDSYFSESIIGRAQKRKLIKINIYNLRDFTTDRHKTVDDKPYGGGAGMVLKIEPIYRAVQSLKSKIKNQKSKIILFSAKGEKFNQKIAQKLAKLDNLILICGRYEGVDERVAKYIADMEVSVGDYVLTGGEIPAMIVVDAVTRLMPGVIKEESLKEESFSQDTRYKIQDTRLEYPQYTRPEVFELNRGVKWRASPPKFRGPKVWRVPKILLSGNHKKIEEWKNKHSKIA